MVISNQDLCGGLNLSVQSREGPSVAATQYYNQHFNVTVPVTELHNGR